jgi:hypothetical protein
LRPVPEDAALVFIQTEQMKIRGLNQP